MTVPLRSLMSALWAFLSEDILYNRSVKWDKVFKKRPSKICGRQPLKI